MKYNKNITLANKNIRVIYINLQVFYSLFLLLSNLYKTKYIYKFKKNITLFFEFKNIFIDIFKYKILNKKSILKSVLIKNKNIKKI